MRRFRVSIGGLMGVVVVAAVGLGALRAASPAWFGGIYLLTRAVLGLAILLAIVQRGGARAWWVGFALFGWGYELLVPPRSTYQAAPYLLPTTQLLVSVKRFMGHPAGLNPADGGPFDGGRLGKLMDYFYLRIGDDLWAMVAALLGGVLAWFAFARTSARPEPAPTTTVERASWGRWIRPTIVVWTVLVLATSIIALRSGWRGGFWAGATFLLVCGLLGLAGLGAILSRGRPRRSCIGAALLGGGYLLLVFAHSPYLPLPSGQLLHALRVWFPVLAGPNAAANARILAELERPIPMEFPNSKPIGDVLEYIKKATATPGKPGIPIYLDPVGLMMAEKSADSEITINLTGVPLGVTLRLALREIGMDYLVKDGLVWITTKDSMYEEADPFYEAAGKIQEQLLMDREARLGLSADLEDPYLVVGHCLLAMLAAGLGVMAAPILARAGASNPEKVLPSA